jgi:hypothetical protein
VTGQTTEIQDLEQSAGVTPPRPAPRRALKSLRHWAKGLTWVMVAIFLAGGGSWAWRVGMNVRRDIWQSTRSIRFKEDVARGFEFGNGAIRFAESRAQLEPFADALADQSPVVLARAGRPDLLGHKSRTFRRLTLGELVGGVVGYMDSIVQGDGEYDMDYPPLRLGVMTWWVRNVQRVRPDMDGFPQQRTEDTSLTQEEDIAEPLLKLNACSAAAASVAMFFLVWLWVHRSFKPAKPPAIERWWRKWRGLPAPPKGEVRRIPRGGWTVPHGIFAFMLAAGGFWYAYTTLVHVPHRPAPAVAVVQVQPGDGAATITATVNSQNQDTQWHVDFGPGASYGQSTGTQSVDTSLDDQQVTARIQPLANGRTVHFRLSASSAGGTTNSDDFSFVNQGAAIDVNGGPQGGIDWPTWTVWLRLLVLFIVMVVSAQMLPPIHRGWACGAVAAMLVWFNPLLLIDSHAWPQWDVWILPFFIAAALMASLNWWMLAGALLGVGCMLKGQLLLGAPILILWPLFEGRFGALARIVIGFVLGAEMIVWPWVVNSPAGLHWVETATIAAGLILIASLMRTALGQSFRQWVIAPVLGRRGDSALLPPAGSEPSPAVPLILASAALAALVLATAFVFHGMGARQALLPAGTMGLFLLLVLLPPWIMPRRSLGFWLAGVFAAAVWISSLAFNGSYSWATLGFAYGSVKHDQMQMGVRVFSNLPSLLAQDYQWDIHDPMATFRLAFTTPGPWRLGWWSVPSVAWAWSSNLDTKTAMAVLYGVCLVIASAAAALHSRRNDRRFLVALVVPWLVFPMVMCQMGGRYPIWALSLSAAMVAVSLELSLLHVLLSAIGFATVARQLLNYDASRWPQLYSLMTPTHPGIAWLLLLVTAIFLAAAVVPSRRET